MANDTEIKKSAAETESERQEARIRKERAQRKRRRRNKKIIIWAIVLVALAAGAYYYFNVRADLIAKQQAMMNQSRQIEVKVEENVYTATIDLSGYVEPNQLQTAKFRSTGAVTGVFVEEGDTVKKGDLLATIDNTQQTSNLQNVKNNIKEAELTGSASQLELLKLQLRTAENNLEYTNLVANFDGIVASVDVNEGDFFDAGSAVVTIVDKSKLKATIEVDEIDMQYIELGQKAKLTFDSYPGQTVEGYVSYIPMLGKYSSQGIGTVAVEITIENPPKEIYPGFSFEGEIIVSGDVSMLIIPQAAITTGRGGVTTVEKKNADGTTTVIPVTVKYLGENQCQLLSGEVNVGDTLVYLSNNSSGFFNMGGGMTVSASPMIMSGF